MNTYKVNIAKLKARLAQQGSNSFDLTKVTDNPDILWKIQHPVVKYTQDACGLWSGKYKTITAPGVLSEIEGQHDTTPADGQGLMSITMSAYTDAALRVITETELQTLVSKISMIKNLPFEGDFNEIFNARMAEVKKNRALCRIIEKISSVHQFRQEGNKGTLLKFFIELLPGFEDVDIIIPEGVRKFASTGWEATPFQICNYLKKKDNWVALNPQFIAALGFENPNALCNVAKDWFDKLYETIGSSKESKAKALEFHGIIASVYGDEAESSSNLVTALMNSSDLFDDFQIRNWRKDQYQKFINDMMIGRILVPGIYTYMQADPYYFLNNVFGFDLPVLQSGEYWFNNYSGNVGAFRSPLISPWQAKKFHCVENDMYWFYKDIILFNGFDGAWEDMSGADHDGDTCAVISDDTEVGKLIVDSIREFDYVVWEKALAAIKEEFSWEALASFNARVAKTDRTGIITNYASRAMDIVNHLDACVKFATQYNCDKIFFIDPALLPDNGYDFRPYAGDDGVFRIRGFRHMSFDSKTKSWRYDEDGIIGVKSFEETLNIAYNVFLNTVDYLSALQNREIDGAKTGVYAEGKSGNDFVDAVKCEFTPQWMITRVQMLGRPVAKFAEHNKYVSLSPLGRLHDYVIKASEEFFAEFDGTATDKTALLYSLLTKQEKEDLNKIITLVDGRSISLIEYLKERRSFFGRNMSACFNPNNGLTSEEAKTKIIEIKQTEAENLVNFANVIGVSISTMAVAAYMVAYAKVGSVGKGLMYGWLLFDALLAVFTRNNKSYSLFPLAKNIDGAEIIDGTLYTVHYDSNGDRQLKKRCDIPNAEDGILLVQNINGKNYAHVHILSNNASEAHIGDVDCLGKTYDLWKIVGFKYCFSGSVENWKEIVRSNSVQSLLDKKFYAGSFDVTMDENGKLVCSINGVSIGTIGTIDTSVFDLVGHTVYVTNIKEFAENSIMGISVKVIR